MDAGRLRHWLLFERLVVELDSDGAKVESWVNAFDTSPTMPCEITPLSGRELMAAQAVQSVVTHRLRVRSRPGFVAALRARNPVSGVVYNIEAVIPDPESGIRYVTMLATVGLNAGGTAT